MPLAPHPASAGRFRASSPSGLAGQTGMPSQRRSLAPLSGPSSTAASVCCPCVLRKASKNSRIDIEFLHYGLLLHRCGSIVARIVQLRLPRLPVLGQHPPAEPAACRDLTGQRDEPPRDPPGGALFLPAIARAVEANERTMYCLLRRISALLGQLTDRLGGSEHLGLCVLVGEAEPHHPLLHGAEGFVDEGRTMSAARTQIP